jgi:hypothetical protein
LRAPDQDGAVVAEPPLSQVAELLAGNQQRLVQNTLMLGRSWADLRLKARQAALDSARTYFRDAGEPLPSRNHGPLLMAGHQPDLFHPGVWVKNFALHGLARTHAGVALNLVVDNDTAKSTSVRVPTRATPVVPRPHALNIPFDRWVGEVPFEERTVADETVFAGFSDRVIDAMQDWGFTPLLAKFWVEARRQARSTSLLGELLARARRELERSWGCHNLEVPVSRLCRTEPFAWFACHLLSDLPRFHAIYNEVVHGYRRRHGLKSENHPVPDLAAYGDWLEAPFWAWRNRQTRRGRLLARIREGKIDLRVGPEPLPSLTLNSAPSQWMDLEALGFKVRSRALTNTLYARLFVADLFIHGIGGGRYDELTDEIIRRFYGMEPPRFLVLSATRLLPLPIFPIQPSEVRRLERLARDLECNPQRYLEVESPLFRDLITEKQTWIKREPGSEEERRRRFEALRASNHQLRPFVVDRLRATRSHLAEGERQLQANAVLRRRDYAFCLFPEEILRPFVTRFL